MRTHAITTAALLALVGSAHAQIADSSFESSGPAGPSPSAAWIQTSTNAGSPIADVSAGNLNAPSNARTGSWVAWFGGFSRVNEVSSITQTANVPAGQQSLRFYFKGNTLRSDNFDTLVLKIDGATVLTITSDDVRSGGQYFNLPYVPITVPIPGASGGSHQFQFVGSTFSSPTEQLPSNFYVDDVAIVSACYANCDGSTTSPVLTAADFTCFLTAFRNGDSYANCDGSTTSPTLTAADFTCFLAAFRVGCP
jgi:hypothetical protein